jgi:UDP-N-acetyl-D-galactosamine dehydrogenase
VHKIGYHPEIILAGRRLNDSMGEYVASQVVKLMIKRNFGKCYCFDARNGKLSLMFANVDVIAALTDYGIAVTLMIPIANPLEVKKKYNLVTKTNCPNSI